MVYPNRMKVQHILVFGLGTMTIWGLLSNRNSGENIATTVEEFKIFFLETNETQVYLQPRQLCSVESAAKNNPRAQILLKSIKAQIKHADLFFEAYPNLKHDLFDPIDVFVHTPLEQWWRDRVVYRAKDLYFRIAHMSDALRLAFIYTYGGLYSDLDRLALRSFEPLFKYNGFFHVFDSTDSLTNSFFVAERAHPFLRYVMETFVEEYDPVCYKIFYLFQ
jgi:hypothetical protein